MELRLNVTDRDIYRIEKTLEDILKAIERLSDSFSNIAKELVSSISQQKPTQDAYYTLAGLTFWCVLIWGTTKVACKAMDFWKDRDSPKYTTRVECYKPGADGRTKKETYKFGYPPNPHMGEHWKGTFTMHFEENFGSKR